MLRPSSPASTAIGKLGYLKDDSQRAYLVQKPATSRSSAWAGPTFCPHCCRRQKISGIETIRRSQASPTVSLISPANLDKQPGVSLTMPRRAATSTILRPYDLVQDLADRHWAATLPAG